MLLLRVLSKAGSAKAENGFTVSPLPQGEPAATALPTGQSWALAGVDTFSRDTPLVSCPCFMCKAHGCSSAPGHFDLGLMGTNTRPAPPGSPGSFESEVSQQKLSPLVALTGHLWQGNWKLPARCGRVPASFPAMHHSRHLFIGARKFLGFLTPSHI